MKLSDFFQDPDTIEELLVDARFFAQRIQDLRLVDDIAALYVAYGMEAEITENQVRHLKDVGGWR
jgi:hypothetical protein